jgi:cytochrome c oxidase subunit 3
VGINILNPLHIPLLNTFILLISGVFVTLSHHSLCVPSAKRLDIDTYEISVLSLLATLVLAVEFTL